MMKIVNSRREREKKNRNIFRRILERKIKNKAMKSNVKNEKEKKIVKIVAI